MQKNSVAPSDQLIQKSSDLTSYQHLLGEESGNSLQSIQKEELPNIILNTAEVHLTSSIFMIRCKQNKNMAVAPILDGKRVGIV